MVNLDTGFMKEGKYHIEVKCKDGTTKTRSRYQSNAPSNALVAAYKHAEKDIYASYAPSAARPLAAGTALKDVPVTWTSLKELADTDAYYIFRLSEGRSGKEFNTQKLIWWDNIFVQRMAAPEAGRNRDRVVLSTELKRDTPYVYFVEITDGNAMGETNICVFQPHQTFST